jgi:D-alanyl-D-alanine carboxypeptidase
MTDSDAGRRGRTAARVAIAALASAAAGAWGQSAARAEHAACDVAYRAIDRSAAATMAQGSPGLIVAVARRGAPSFVRAYGSADLEQGTPMRRASVFRMASLTKQFTAAAVLALAEEGRLGLDDRLSRHLPELPQIGSITVRQLLVQTSGIPDYAEDPEGMKWNAGGRSGAEMLEWVGRLARTPQFAPGTRWQYSNSNYVLLGEVVQRASGSSLPDYFARRLFARAGLRDTAFDVAADVVPARVRGYAKSRSAAAGFVNAAIISYTIPGAAGGLRTTADDLLRWSDALFAGKVIGRDTLRIMTTAGRLADGRTTKFGMPIEWQKGLNADYAMGLFVTPVEGGRRIWHSGDIAGFATWLAHYPERGTTILLAQNSESADLDKDGVERAVFALAAANCAPVS